MSDGMLRREADDAIAALDALGVDAEVREDGALGEGARLADHAFVPAGAPLERCAECGEPPSAHPKAVNVKLVAFIYLLFRDHLPTGKIVRLLDEIDGLSEGVTFTAPELESLARRYAARLSP